MISKQMPLMVAVSLFGWSPLASGQEPEWWSESGTKIWQTSSVNASNHAPVNIGQLKNMAAKAKQHLDLKLASAGGAGSEITSMVNAFTTGPGNHAVANVGQVKAVAAPFYRRFAHPSIGFNAGAQLRQRMGLSSNQSSVTQGVEYPWVAPTDGSHHAPANIGQLKLVFGFDLGAWSGPTDSDLDGWSDVFEISVQTNPLNAASVPGDDEDPDGDGLDNYWERELGLQPGNANTDGDLLSDGDEDADNDGVKNRLDAHPLRQLIAWSRVAESRYVVVPLENGFAPYANRNPKFWHLNDGGDVVGFANPASPDSSRPGYRVPIVWSNGAWTTLGTAGLLEVANASRSNSSTMYPVRFYTHEGGIEAPIQIDNDRRIAARAQLQDMVSLAHAPNWGANRWASLIWEPASGSVGSTPIPIGRDTAWQNTSTWNYKTAFETNGTVCSMVDGGVVLVNDAYVSESDPASHRRVSASPPAYQNLGIRGTPLSQNSATARGASSDGVVCGNFSSSGSSPPYAVWTQNAIVHIFPDLPPNASEMTLPLAIQRLTKGPGSSAPDPLVVLDGNGRLAVSTDWSQPVILGTTNSSGAAAEVLDPATTTINTRGEILWPWNTFLPLPAPPPRLWRNGRLHSVNNLLHSSSWTVSAVHHLNNHGVILATASSATSGSLPVLLVPVEVLQHPITATSGAGNPPRTHAPIRFCRWIDAYPSGVRDDHFADKDRDRFQICIPLVVSNLTKMKIKATELHSAVVNATYQHKTMDGDYEVDVTQLNGKMVSEPILLVSDGDDDKSFNGRGADDGKNDQTLLADFGSKIIVTFPELGNATATFVAQAPVGEIRLDLFFCVPGSGAVPAVMVGFINREVNKMKEIYRQIGIRVTESEIAPLSFPVAWLQPNGTSDPQDNLNPTETQALMSLVQGTPRHLKRARVGFVDANLTSPQGAGVYGIGKAVGDDPCLVSLNIFSRDSLNVLAHEVGHCSMLGHNFDFDPNIYHWLMRGTAGQDWSNDSTAPKRLTTNESEVIRNVSPFYVPLN